MAQFTEHGIRLSSMCPTFLNSNSTSHTWPFSAIAELIDNAADPGVLARQIWIDIHEEAGQLCMTFTDNGSGMTPNKLHKMLSFGFTEKGVGRTSVQAIGVYGNGFKSGSMRLGRDALIFTKNGGCQSVGMLSQTYLENIKAQSVIVPIAPFNQKNMVVTDDSEASLAAILQHSIISTQEQIQAHFDSIASKKGTKILIWNLRRAKDGNPEIDFETDPADFRLPEIQIEELKKNLKNNGLLRAEQIIPDMHYSLKAYLSILYLKPRIHVILRGKKIPTKLVSEQLTQLEHDVYKPHFSKDKVRVTFGVNEKNKECYGIMMYHKNRLIKAYEKVGCQLKTFGQRAGVGVIGIIECDFLKPAHNKQDFEYTKEYRLTLGALGMKLNDYWKVLTERKAKPRESVAVTEDFTSRKEKTDNDPMWLQCEECRKWRSVPAGHYRVMPENWNCSKNPNPRYRSCSSPEETDDNEDLLKASYQKNHHKRESSRTKQRAKSPKLEESPQKDGPLHRLSEMVSSRPELTEPAELPSSAHEPPTAEVTNAPEETGVNTDLGTEAATTCTKDRDSVIKDSALIHTQKAPEPSVQQDEEVKEIPLEQEETTQHNKTTRTISIKRKLEKLIEDGEKRRRLYEEHLSSIEDNNLATPEKSEDISVDQEEIHDVNRPNETQHDSNEAKVKKLEELERESHKLRLLLGLETIRKAVATNTENPEAHHRTAATRDIECQTDLTESVSSGRKTPVPKLHDTVLHTSRTMCGFKDTEQNKSRKERNDSSRSSENDDHNAKTVHDKLCGIRNNVVVLLTALLPQLDLSGISLETSDVDNILQQIIEVNALKL